MVCMKRLLAILFIFSAGSALADDAAVAASMPPPDYAKPVFVDAKGCIFVRATVGGWVLWVQQLDSRNLPVCGELPGAGPSQSDILAAQKL